ncbi:MAG: DNA mismatch repair endonuclease MutL [Plesiomonas sp.]|uniref:DNA mismatch repair endonuclease MutL n=1 Tax=Plesiomonas sp. TaxID=2486279 RepID=UPI003F351F3F
MAIQILPAQLANQIAAGEVVERPSSVVKELVENSLDAGATRIDIDIDKGGAQLIRIRDDGCGINKTDLALALARHATSKISSLDDLEAIVSLGFRGEALASISSVSRLLMTSRTADQPEAWQAYAEGRDMQVTVKPAAHPVGTTLEVRDLFYNTPARRKFLRTEKTEFTHIDEVVRRIALARFDVSFTLRHNGKMVRQYRAAATQEQKERRLAGICGPAFLQHAVAVEWQHAELTISGWVCSAQGSRQQNDMAYSYVNGRMMRDKLINHAIRQAYQTLLQEAEYPAFVLYLTLAPNQVDVNVHPAKHEVRFHQARLVHDFIYQAVLTALQHTVDEAGSALNHPVGECSPDTDAFPDHSPTLALPTTPPLTLATPRIAAGSSQFAPSVQARQAGIGQVQEIPSGSQSGEQTSTQLQETAAGYQAANPAVERLFSRQPNSRSPHKSLNHQLNPDTLQRESAVYARLLQAELPSTDAETAIIHVTQTSVGTVTARAPSDSTHPVAQYSAPSSSLGRALAIVAEQYLLVERAQGIGLLSLPRAAAWRKQAQLLPHGQPLKAQPLLIPLMMKADAIQLQTAQQQQPLLQQLGIDLRCNERQKITVLAVPLPLRHHNLQQIIPLLLNKLQADPTLTIPTLVEWLVGQLKEEQAHWTLSQAVTLLADLELLCPEKLRQQSPLLIKPVELEAAITALQND